MRKTFIEAQLGEADFCLSMESLPLMRKTFIEAMTIIADSKRQCAVSSAYAEDFH